MWPPGPFLVFRLAKLDGFGHRAERPASFVHGLSRFSGRVAQPLKVAYHIVQPRLGIIEKPVTPGGEEKKGKAGTNGRSRQDFRQLRFSVHTNLLYAGARRPRAHTLALDDSPSLNQLDEQCDDGEHEQYVNETAERVRAHDTQHPQHHENEKNCPQHPSTSVNSSCEYGKHGVCHRAPL